MLVEFYRIGIRTGGPACPDPALRDERAGAPFFSL